MPLMTRLNWELPVAPFDGAYVVDMKREVPVNGTTGTSWPDGAGETVEFGDFSNALNSIPSDERASVARQMSVGR